MIHSATAILIIQPARESVAVEEKLARDGIRTPDRIRSCS